MKFNLRLDRLKKINPKTWVIVGLFVLLVVTGYLNFALSGADDQNAAIQPTPTGLVAQDDAAVSVFFETFKTERVTAREQEIAFLDSVINGGGSTAETVNQAQQQKLSVANAMEKEVIIEGLLKVKGFGDAVVTFNQQSINVVVKEKQLDDVAVAKILDIVTSETGAKAADVKVIPAA